MHLAIVVSYELRTSLHCFRHKDLIYKVIKYLKPIITITTTIIMIISATTVMATIATTTMIINHCPHQHDYCTNSGGDDHLGDEDGDHDNNHGGDEDSGVGGGCSDNLDVN